MRWPIYALCLPGVWLPRSHHELLWHKEGTVTLGNGHRVATVTYDMEQFLRSCVDRYLEVAGDVKLNKVVTPETHEETKHRVSRKPAKEGPSVVQLV